MGVPRIYIGFHSYGICPTSFAIDLARLMRYSGTIIPAAIHERSCYVDSARNKLVRNFLTTDGTHLMMMDVDISFEPDAVLKTFNIMQAMGLDAVYGNYALGNGANSIFGAPENAANEASVRVNLESNKVYTDIVTGGTGWLLMSRELLARMEKECDGPWHWFARDVTTDGKDRRGEDITFGLRMYRMQPRPKVAGITTVLLGHEKTQKYFPNFMSGVAAKASMPGVCIPNPFESEPENYATIGNAVVDLRQLSAEAKATVLAEAAKWREAYLAGKAGTRVESSGRQARLEGEAEGGLHLRNPEENRVEAQAREGAEANGHGEGEVNG